MWVVASMSDTHTVIAPSGNKGILHIYIYKVDIADGLPVDLLE